MATFILKNTWPLTITLGNMKYYFFYWKNSALVHKTFQCTVHQHYASVNTNKGILTEFWIKKNYTIFFGFLETELQRLTLPSNSKTSHYIVTTITSMSKINGLLNFFDCKLFFLIDFRNPWYVHSNLDIANKSTLFVHYIK